MKRVISKEINDFFEAILTLKNAEECEMFFGDICSIKELSDISQRLVAAKMLVDGESYVKITQKTGMSTATISRVNRSIAYGDGGYKMVFDRIGGKAEKESL
jgi:TrpR-related protein YerC/YecD